MRVLVTGGAGYIGSVVTDALLEDGHNVVVVDNLARGHREAVPQGAKFEYGDLLHDSVVEDVLRRHRIEAVIHMAADALVGESVEHPAKYYRNNVQAGISLFNAMQRQSVDRLVISSTAAVYGAPQAQPIEESQPPAPTNPYGETKLALERALRWYETAYRLRVVALRYFNAAGATALRGEDHDPETHVIPLVLAAAAGDRPHVAVHGADYATPDGSCVRDFVHVEDLARAHVLALGALAKTQPSRAFNVGVGGGGHSVRQVIDVARRVTGRDIPIRIGPRRPGDPPVLVASPKLIMTELGWQPRHTTLETIVESAWRWMRARRNQG